MAREKKTSKIPGIPGRHTLRQARLVRELPRSKTLGEAAVKAGYSPKNARQSGHQALKTLRGRVPDMMDRLGISEEEIIDKHLRRHLIAQKTVFVREERIVKRKVGRRTEEVVRHVVKKYTMNDNQAQLIAMDKALLMHGSYAPRDPKEAAQFGVKVIVNNLGLVRDGSRPVIDIKPGMDVPALTNEASNGNKKNGNKNGAK
jgi:Terminase small subunit